MINPKTGKSIGGSLLPSSDPTILTPILTPLGTYKIEPDFDRDTFVLKRDGVFVAEHPNAYSLHCLVKRIKKRHRFFEQAQFIVECGGKVDFAQIPK